MTLRPVYTMLLLGIAPAVGLGIGRFAYALVLPDMRDSLGWSYATAGAMNTISFVGHVVGALGANIAIRRVGMFRAVWFGAIACVASLAIAASSGNVIVFASGRLLAGIAAAVAFIAGGALAMNVAQAQPARAAFHISLFYSMPAVGIGISAIAVPAVLAACGPGSWWIAWGVLAAISAVLITLVPIAKVDAPAPPTGAAGRAPTWPMFAYLTGYFLYAASYIAYMTFMIAYVRSTGGGPMIQSLFWIVLGIGAFVHSWVWGGMLARLRSGRTTALMTVVTMIAAGLPLLDTSLPVLLISAGVFGNSFFAVVGSTTAFARVNFRRELWPSAVGQLTAAHGAGLIVGPIATGAITDATGELRAALAVSAAVLALAALITACQRAIPLPENQSR